MKGKRGQVDLSAWDEKYMASERFTRQKEEETEKLLGEKYCMHYGAMAGPGVTICDGCYWDKSWSDHIGCGGIIRDWNALSKNGTGTCEKCRKAVENHGARRRMSSKEYHMAVAGKSAGARSHAEPPPPPPGLHQGGAHSAKEFDICSLCSVQWPDTETPADTPPQATKEPQTAFWWGTSNQVSIPDKVTPAMMAGARCQCKLEIKSRDEALGKLSDCMVMLEKISEWYRNGTDLEQP